MSWEIVLSGDWPMSMLTAIGDVAREFPGEDELRLHIGQRTLAVPIDDCKGLRIGVTELIHEQQENDRLRELSG